jgi:uncharacterized phage protein gp47/JayE
MSFDQFESLMTPQTVEDARALVQASGEAVDVDFAGMPPLSWLRLLALSAVPAAVNTRDQVLALVARGGLKDYAEGEFLELLAIDMYGLEGGRIQAGRVQTQVVVANGSAGSYDFGPLDQQFKAGSRVFRNVAAFRLAPFNDPDGGDAVVVDVIADAEGSDYNVSADAIVTMVPAFDLMTCSNPAAASAADKESDAQLRARCTDALGALSPGGSPQAYAEIARNTYVLPDGSYIYTRRPQDHPGAASVGITRVQVAEHIPDPGDVTVYLASSDSAPSAPVVAAVDALIMQWARPVGVRYIGTFAATPVPISIAYTATLRKRFGVSPADAQTFVLAALTTFFADEDRNPLGGIVVPPSMTGALFRTELISVISQADGGPGNPQPIVNVPALTPGSDIVLAAGELAVLGTVTHTILEIP